VPSRSGAGRRLAWAVPSASARRVQRLRSLGEPTSAPEPQPARGPPYWKSRVLRRAAFGDEAAYTRDGSRSRPRLALDRQWGQSRHEISSAQYTEFRPHPSQRSQAAPFRSVESRRNRFDFPTLLNALTHGGQSCALNPQYQPRPHQMAPALGRVSQHSKRLVGWSGPLPPLMTSWGPIGRHTCESSSHRGHPLTSLSEPSISSHPPPKGGSAVSTPGPSVDPSLVGSATSPPQAMSSRLLRIDLCKKFQAEDWAETRSYDHC